VSEILDPPASTFKAKPNPREIPRLIDRLGSAAPATHAAAADALTRLGAEAAPALRWALRDFDYSLRSRAAEVLARIGEPAVPMLQDATRDHDVEVRLWAVWALGRIGGTAAVEALEAVPRDKDPRVRRLWAQSLAEMDGPVSTLSTHLLERAAEDLDAAIVVPALQAFARKGRGEAIRVLTAALKNPDLKIQSTAVDCLQEIEGELPYDAIDRVLRSNSQTLRKQGIQLLKRCQAPQVHECLERLIFDSDLEVVATAASVLAQRGAPAAVILCGILWSDAFGRQELADSGGTVGIWTNGIRSNREHFITDAICGIGAPAIPVLREHLSRGPSEGSNRGWRAVAKLTERAPCPELRCLLPLFPRHLSPLAFLMPDHRQYLTNLRRRIEQVTEEWKALPLTAGAPEPSTEALPLPASAAAPAAAVLPRPVEAETQELLMRSHTAREAGPTHPSPDPAPGLGTKVHFWMQKVLGQDE